MTDADKEMIEAIKADTNPVHASRAAHALLGRSLATALQRVNQLQRELQIELETVLQLNEDLAHAVGENANAELPAT